jgi:hypothetical protein
VKEILEYIAKAIVDEPESVQISERAGDRGTVLELRVAQDDMGKVIGKGGRTVKAIRKVMNAAAVRERTRVLVDVVD